MHGDALACLGLCASEDGEEGTQEHLLIST